MSDMQGKSCSGTNLGDTRVDPSTLVCHTKGCTNPGFAYYYNNQRQARKAWENWAFCSGCITTLRDNSRMSSRKSHQKKKDKEDLNKAKLIIVFANNANENQTIVEKPKKIIQIKKVRVGKVFIWMTIRLLLKEK